MWTRLPAIGLLLGLLVALGPVAGAQLQPAGLAVTAPSGALELDPGQATEVEVTLENQGTVDGTVTLTVGTEGQGWTSQLSETEIGVPAGASRTVTLELIAPSEREDQATAGLVTVTGTLTDASGQFQATDDATVQATLTPAPVVPPEPFPWLLVSAVAAGLMVATAGAVAWLVVRRRETGIALEAQARSQARAGDQAMVPVVLENTSDRPRLAEVVAHGLPDGWTAATSLPRIPLAPGERKDLWVAVRPPSDVTEAQASFELRARPAEAKGFRARQAVEVEVRDRGLQVGDQVRDLLEQRPYSTRWDD